MALWKSLIAYLFFTILTRFSVSSECFWTCSWPIWRHSAVFVRSALDRANVAKWLFQNKFWQYEKMVPVQIASTIISQVQTSLHIIASNDSNVQTFGNWKKKRQFPNHLHWLHWDHLCQETRPEQAASIPALADVFLVQLQAWIAPFLLFKLKTIKFWTFWDNTNSNKIWV